MVAENYRYVLKKVEEACARSGRDPKDVTLIAVSKTKPIDDDRRSVWKREPVYLVKIKCRSFCDKCEQLPEDLHWHLIGHLQRNKVKYIVAKAELIHSVDSLQPGRRDQQRSTEKMNRGK